MSAPAKVSINPYFNPLGNSPPVCFTRSMPPGEATDALLLGHGDVRTILFTAHNDDRKLDVTCCDKLAAAIARNILILSLIMDDKDEKRVDSLLAIYCHLEVDAKASDIIRSRATKLYDLSATMDGWHRSRYGLRLRVCDSVTLSEVRNMWKVYSANPRDESVRDYFTSFIERSQDKTCEFLDMLKGLDFIGLQSTIPATVAVYGGQLHSLFEQYREHGGFDWNTGVTDGIQRYPNLTFLTGEHESVPILHHVTNPIFCSHLALASVPTHSYGLGTDTFKELPVGKRMIEVVRVQFRMWAASYKKRFTKIQVRFFRGDAVAFAHTLQHKRATSANTANWYRDQYSFQPLVLDGPDYASGVAPLDFDVIDTSNLCNDMGALTLLTAVSPLLRNKLSSTLYTEVVSPKRNLHRETLDRLLCGDVPTLSAILGLFPVEYWTNASTVPLGEEQILSVFDDELQIIANALTVRTTWKRPLCLIPSNGPCPAPAGIQFDDTDQLAELLFHIYASMFRHEQEMYVNPQPPADSDDPQYLAEIRYHRASFVSILRFVQSRAVCNWTVVVIKVLGLIMNKRGNVMDGYHSPEFHAYLHVMGVFTIPVTNQGIRRPRKLEGDVRDWAQVPSVVCITLEIPREKLRLFTDPEQNGRVKISTPFLRCHLLMGPAIPGIGYRTKIFAACHVAFGDISTRGRRNDDSFEVLVKEDEAGWSGSRPLIASFYVPSAFVDQVPRDLQVAIGIHPTIISISGFAGSLGTSMEFYQAKVSNDTGVYITQYAPNLQAFPIVTGFFQATPTSPVNVAGDNSLTGDTSLIATVDKTTGCIVNYVNRLDITCSETKRALESDECPVKLKHLSPADFEIKIGDRVPVRVSFPVCLIKTSLELQVDRESSRVELSGKPSNCHRWNIYPHYMYPVHVRDGKPIGWNMPYLQVQNCPVIDVEGAQAAEGEEMRWLRSHLTMTLSARERGVTRMVAAAQSDAQSGDCRLACKATIAAHILHFPGRLGDKKRIYRLGGPDAGIYILPSTLRLDLANRTVFLDCAVFQFHGAIPEPIRGDMRAAIASSDLHVLNTDTKDLRLWRRFLPACVERCRTWEHQPGCEYAAAGATIPLSTVGGRRFLCSCGEGRFDADFRSQDEDWPVYRQYAVRAAISPVFWAPFAERSARRGDF
ncbi:putative mynd finger family protein [Rosellinia necatrix]|uniref:Putative mynd finger family protein n=1 Tax=Rosellinia necatrix TaxID=77044 RepID=A0A1W2TPT1_ROSNE|nr:putative mynd finger family protein [Rosellinia necatrix]